MTVRECERDREYKNHKKMETLYNCKFVSRHLVGTSYTRYLVTYSTVITFDCIHTSESINHNRLNG